MRILITGATGLIGSRIVKFLRGKGIAVNYLTTTRSKIKQEKDYQGFFWDPSVGEIDLLCLEGVGAIIHLSGASVFRRWTKENRELIRDSRVDSAQLLNKALSENEHTVGQFISASGINIYPSSFEKLYHEDEMELDSSFLGQVVLEWEKAADKFTDLGLRVAKVRTGLVLSRKGGALPQMQRPIEMGIGAPLGNGRQWQSWIHIMDLVRIYVHILEKGLEGVYNAVAPNPVTNEDLTREIARNMGKRIVLPRVPAFAIKLVMGEMGNLALSSQMVASKKIEDTGFSFHFISLTRALQDLDKKKTG